MRERRRNVACGNCTASVSPECSILLYDIVMLEDLDQLSIRLAALVAYTQELASEAESLRTNLSQAQSERDALQAKLAQEGTQAKALNRKVDAYASEQAALQGSLDLFKQEQSTLQAQLQSREHEVSTLRAASAQARERIEAVLERLPGAIAASEQGAQ